MVFKLGIDRRIRSSRVTEKAGIWRMRAIDVIGEGTGTAPILVSYTSR
jgi:hypothetical protein